MRKRDAWPSWLLPLLCCLLFVGLGELVMSQLEHRNREHEAQLTRDRLAQVNTRLMQNLNATLHLASGVAAYIQANRGRIDEADILPWLKALHDNNPLLRNIGLAPNNRITYIFPLTGNEAAVNLYLPDLADQWPAIAAAIAQRRASLDGPIRLVQGGRGVAYRLPVFLSDGSYWGVISTIIDLDQLLQDTEQYAADQGLALAISFDEDSARVARATYLESQPFPLHGLDWQLSARLRQPQPAFGLRWQLLNGLMALVLAGVLWALILRGRQTLQLQASLTEQASLLQAAYESSPHGVAVLDADWRILACNQPLCRLAQRPKVALLDNSLGLLWSEETFRQLQQALTANGLTGQVLMLETDKGPPLPVEVDVHHLQDASAHWMVHIRDIRERFQLQQIQAEFISTASHELRTPLTAVIGAIGLMESGGLGEVPATMRPLLQTANQSCKYMHRLISDLLDTNRLLNGTLQLKPEPLVLSAQIHEAIAALQPAALARDVTIDCQLEPGVTVHADALRVTQVLINLLGNAIRFSPPHGQVQVNLQARPEDRVAHVSVRDHGPGIPESFRGRIFQRFAQADSSDTRAQGGTGLGLFISKSLIERMDGRIGYDSVPGEGATFWFELPL